jgi:hypothetical protein
MKYTPEMRAEIALKAINHVYPITKGKDATEHQIIDLVTDLLHLAKAYGVHSEGVLQCARYNFEEETV